MSFSRLAEAKPFRGQQERSRRGTRVAPAVALGAALFLLLPQTASGQAAALGSIRGRVTDPSQAPIPDASITISHTRTGLVSTAATTVDGDYTGRFLPPGTYSVTAHRSGFQRTTQPNVVVAAASNPTVNLTLAVGAVTESITVSESVGLVEAETARQIPLAGRIVF